MNLLKKMIKDEDAQGLVEYILIIAVVALVAVAVVRAFGDRIVGWFEKTGDKLDQGLGLDDTSN